MAPTSPLHGLNIVQTESSPQDQYADNTQDPLLANTAAFPDLAAQLDLWSNLTFQTDEPLSRKAEEERTPSSALGDDDKDEDSGETEVEGPASLEAHVNAVNPIPTPTPQPHLQQHPTQGIPHPNYDMGAFLAGFGQIDPFLLPQVTPIPHPQLHTQHQAVPSHAATLAQLLAAYPLAAAGPPPFLPHTQVPGIAPAALSTAAQQQQSQPNEPTATTTKRSTRSRRTSSSPSASPSVSDEQQQQQHHTEPGSIAVQALSAAEDKRRRNTAASARFRLKKKEREAALERRAQELETRVNALERECEGLRRENGWLKGLVVGVTGASQGATVVPNTGSPSPSNSGAKRKRTDEAANAKEEAKKVAVSTA